MSKKLHISAAVAVVLLLGLSILLIASRSAVIAASPVFSPNQELAFTLVGADWRTGRSSGFCRART